MLYAPFRFVVWDLLPMSARPGGGGRACTGGALCVGLAGGVTVFVVGVVGAPGAELFVVHGAGLAGFDVIGRAKDGGSGFDGVVLGDDLCGLAGFRAGDFNAVQVKQLVIVPFRREIAFLRVRPFDSLDVVSQAAGGFNSDGGLVVVVHVVQVKSGEGERVGVVPPVAETRDRAGVLV